MANDNPHNTDLILGRAHEAHQAGRYDEAERLYRQLLSVAPADMDGCNLLALLYLQTGRPGAAVPLIRKAVRICPDDAQAHYNLGVALKDSGEVANAARHFRDSARLAPENPDAFNALGNVLRQLDMPDAAIEAYRSAFALAPGNAAVSSGLSDALNDQGVARNRSKLSAEAAALFGEAATINPENAEAWMNLGIVSEQCGNSSKAADAFVAAIKARPDFVDAHFHLARLTGRDVSAAELAAMQTLAETDNLGPEEQALLAYGVSCAFEKRGQYEQEFDALRRAHVIKSRRGRFDLGRMTERFDALRELFPHATDFPAAESGARGSELVFIVGMPRSGTTLTEQILASHESAVGCGESGIVSKAAVRTESLSNKPYPASLGLLTRADIDSIAATALTGFRKLAPDSPRVIDTTPTNFIHCGLIATLWPAARIIHCVRHPLDVCLSIYQNALSDDHAYAHEFDTLASYFVAYDELMQHWLSVLPGRVLELRYGRLITEFEPAVRETLEFCDLPFDERCLRFHETRRVVKTPSAGQVRRPIYTGSLDRWKKYHKQLAPLRTLLAEQIERFEAR